MKKIAEILLYAWQLPQNLIGLLLVLILQPEEAYDMDGCRLYYATRMRGGISLGRYVIVRSWMKDYTGNTERHELGHAKQSRMLGWFYLFVIGIPSIIMGSIGSVMTGGLNLIFNGFGAYYSATTTLKSTMRL